MKKKILFFNFISFLSFNLYPIENYDKLVKTARANWLDGRVNDAIETYKYLIWLSSDTSDIVNLTKELAVLLNESSQNSEAKIYIEKAQALKKDDPYLEFEKGWAYLSLKKYPEAKSSFENVLTMTTDPDLIYNSRFMQAMTEINLGGDLKAIEDFQTVYQKYPYLLSASSYMIAKCYERAKKRNYTITFLKETLNYDEKNIQALITLAQNYDDVNYYLPAWQSFYTLSEIDLNNKKFIKKRDSLSKYIKDKHDNLLFWERIGWPIHSELLKVKGINKIKVGLFTDSEGEQTFLNKFYFISNTDFDIIDSKLGKSYKGKKNSQYEVSYIEKSRIFEIKDNTSSKVYTTRQNFSIKTIQENGVILIKNPEISNTIRGIDRSDRELSNEIIVKVSTEGMKLSNITYIEHILPPIISSINIPKDNNEFLKALSIVIRTILAEYKNKPFNQEYDMCDSKKCIEFKGLQHENPSVLKATEETSGQTLYKDNMPAKISYHYACGGKTLDGIDDNTNFPSELNPYSLNKFFMSAPKQDLYCLPEDATKFSNISWIILLDPYWIEERINERYKVGKIKNIQVLKRSSQGEVFSIIIKGSANDVLFENQEEINELLSANTLRSMLFNIRPIMSGSLPEYFLLRGIGTGNLRGLCIMGAYGMAKHLGYKYDKILNHYFPNLKIIKKI